LKTKEVEKRGYYMATAFYVFSSLVRGGFDVLADLGDNLTQELERFSRRLHRAFPQGRSTRRLRLLRCFRRLGRINPLNTPIVTCTDVRAASTATARANAAVRPESFNLTLRKSAARCSIASTYIEVPAVPYKELRSKSDGQSLASIRERMEESRETQRQRGFYNAQIPPSQLRTLCALDESGERTLEMAIRRMNLSARAHDRMLRVARTIADLDHAESVSAKHLAEAVQCRNLDRNYWN
jgi:hypothetical protein